MADSRTAIVDLSLIVKWMILTRGFSLIVMKLALSWRWCWKQEVYFASRHYWLYECRKLAKSPILKTMWKCLKSNRLLKWWYFKNVKILKYYLQTRLCCSVVAFIDVSLMNTLSICKNRNQKNLFCLTLMKFWFDEMANLILLMY